MEKIYKKHEQDKKTLYNTRIIEVEKGTFTPVIFSCSGGASPEATNLLKTIATKLAEKRQESYATCMNFVRRRIGFDLVKTCVISFRGHRGATRDLPIEEIDIGLNNMEMY